MQFYETYQNAQFKKNTSKHQTLTIFSISEAPRCWSRGLKIRGVEEHWCSSVALLVMLLLLGMILSRLLLGFRRGRSRCHHALHGWWHHRVGPWTPLTLISLRIKHAWLLLLLLLFWRHRRWRHARLIV